MTSEEKMDLDAIDELAWFRIIEFLDYNSRYQCRHLSRTIKRYVDLSGLNLLLKCSTSFRIAEHNWNPDVRFSKVHFSCVKWIEDHQHLNITAQHRVKYLYLESCERLSLSAMSFLLQADWTRNIETLVCGSLVLEFPKDYLPESQSTIEFPCLRKVYLIAKRGPKVQMIKMLSMLLLKLRSPRMNLIFVDLVEFHLNGVEVSLFSVLGSLAEFIQCHAATLQTIIFKSNATVGHDLRHANIPGTFRAIPHGLKHFDVDFFAYLDDKSSWFKMLNGSLDHLESFTNKLERDVPLNPIVYSELLSNLCRLNRNTLNYIFLTIRSDFVLDLNTFSCCASLKYLYLEIKYRVPALPVYLRNLTLLPVSLKCFWVDQVPGDEDLSLDELPRIAMESENISNFSKFRNLVNFWIDAPITFHNSDQQIQFTQVFLRLRKLDFFRLGCVNLIDQDTTRIFQNRQLFFDKLYENNAHVTKTLFPGSRFNMQLAVSPDYNYIKNRDFYSLENTTEEFEPVHYGHVYGYLNLARKIEVELSLAESSGSVSRWPSPLDHTIFQTGCLG